MPMRAYLWKKAGAQHVFNTLHLACSLRHQPQIASRVGGCFRLRPFSTRQAKTLQEGEGAEELSTTSVYSPALFMSSAHEKSTFGISS
eukprot:1192123-Prorocentrum_minimum.AAC.3